jgi:hypothetical protein
VVIQKVMILMKKMVLMIMTKMILQKMVKMMKVIRKLRLVKQILEELQRLLHQVPMKVAMMKKMTKRMMNKNRQKILLRYIYSICFFFVMIGKKN